MTSRLPGSAPAPGTFTSRRTVSFGKLPKVKATRNNDWPEPPMEDARYLRAQAALCLEIADQMSDPKSREKMRASAAEYHARAEALEEGEEIPRVLK